MINVRESFYEFIKSEVATKLGGITTPEIRTEWKQKHQPPDFQNVLNVNFYDDIPERDTRFDPSWVNLGVSFELLLEIDPNNPKDSEIAAYKALPLINEIMGIQWITKYDYSVDPKVDLGSIIEWRKSYPLGWREGASTSERYTHKTCFFTLRYFQEKINV